MTFAKDDYVSDGRMTIIDKNASGSVIRVDDAYPTPHTINKTTVFGKSDQLTTTGKNLMRLINGGTTNGVNLTANGDGSYHVKGTQTAGFTRFYTDDEIKKPLAEFGLKVGDTVYLSAAEASSKLYLAMFFFDEKGSNVYTQVATSANVTKYTIAENVTQAYVCISLDGSVGTSVDSDFHPMISLNSNKDWEPYTGGKPSPSPDYPQEITNLSKAELVITSRNICPDAELLGGVQYNSGIPMNKYGVQAKFPYVQKSETNGIGAVLNTIKGVTYSIAYLGKANTAAVGIAEYKSADDVGDVSKVVSYARVGSSKKISLTASIDGVMVFVLASQWTDGKTNLNTFNKEDMIISVGEPCSTYTPHQSKSTVIDLKGNELLSIPNGVRDEVVIDAEGNVSLIKRIGISPIPNCIKISDTANQTGKDGTTNYLVALGTLADVKIGNGMSCMCNKFTDGGISKNRDTVRLGANDNHVYVYTSNEQLLGDKSLAHIDNWMKSNEVTIIYQLAEPQTIPLGKVEAPLLRNTVQTIYSNTNIPTTMNINYKSYLQEDTMAEKKYLDLAGLTGYDAKLKAAIDAKDATTLQGAKAYADSLGANYDAAGSATTAKTEAIQAAKGYTDGEVTKVNTTVAAVKKTADKGVADAAGAKSAADKAQGEVDALETLVGTLPEDAGVATVVAYVDKKTEGMASDTLLKQLQTTVGQHTTDISGLKEKDTALQGAVDKAQGAATANKATIDQLVGADKGKSVRTIANEELAAQLIPETADETLNTLKEIADWIQKHPNDAAAMNSAIEKLKTLIGTIPSEGVTAKDITGYIAEVKAALEKSVAAEKSRAEAAESGLGGRITTLEGKFGDGEGSVASQIAAAKQEAISTAAGDATTKANKAKSDAVTEAKSYTDGEITKVKTAADELSGKVTAAEGKITALEEKAHTHTNAEVLNGITAPKVSGWDVAATNQHTHDNKSALDKINDGKITTWDTAEANAKSYADGLVAAFVPVSVEEINNLFTA